VGRGNLPRLGRRPRATRSPPDLQFVHFSGASSMRGGVSASGVTGTLLRKPYGCSGGVAACCRRSCSARASFARRSTTSGRCARPSPAALAASTAVSSLR